MKRLVMIGGPMGVGKTAACRELQKLLPDNVFLDGDWCWDAVPFQVTPETKAMVLENIAFLLNQFLRCSAYQNVLFCWVLHEQAIWTDLCARLALEGVKVIRLSLVCTPQALTHRLEGDIARGIRTPDVTARSLERLSRCDRLDIPLIDTTDLTPRETAERIIALL